MNVVNGVSRSHKKIFFFHLTQLHSLLTGMTTRRHYQAIHHTLENAKFFGSLLLKAHQ